MDKAEILKQIPVNVTVKEVEGENKYFCPTCDREAIFGQPMCNFCKQKLSFDKIKKAEVAEAGYETIATLSFSVANDFTPGDCRKCPISFIAKDPSGNIYACPLNPEKKGCPLKLTKKK